MASTITVQSVVNWAQTQIRLIPLVGSGGVANEPAQTIANILMQDLFAFPNIWKFNRSSIPSFQTVEFQQDYTAPVGDISFLERVVFEDYASQDTPKHRREGECVFSLPMESWTDHPWKISKESEAQNSSTIRLWPVPTNYVWTVYCDYQVKPPIVSLGGTWAPVPDELAFVVRAGFLYFAYLHADDPRSEAAFQKYQLAIQRARGIKDAEQQHAAFFPSRPIMIG
jgi:hypothetical protein